MQPAATGSYLAIHKPTRPGNVRKHRQKLDTRLWSVVGGVRRVPNRSDLLTVSPCINSVVASRGALSAGEATGGV